MQKLFVILLLSFFMACDGNESIGPGSGRVIASQDWLIIITEVFDVLGRDGIPSLSNPPLIEASQAGFV